MCLPAPSTSLPPVLGPYHHPSASLV
ncbi:hypothetical protein E2C01_094895 [Portunus trituberculatus]|uniref:Uncharacterized protein n=1 Tax=Portunus trituberculatus TaxID=210409 RepID=A0A5B7JXD4_PORTR|nr:hypothetical protein [Portunus trituberculatus]